MHKRYAKGAERKEIAHAEAAWASWVAWTCIGEEDKTPRLWVCEVQADLANLWWEARHFVGRGLMAFGNGCEDEGGR